MRTSTFASVLAAVAAAAAQNTSTSGTATAITNNPAGAVYIATLPETAFDKVAYPDGGNVKGYVVAASSPDGAGVIFQAKFSGLPSEGGPFTYHIHDKPVPANGNCTATAAHLDPYGRGDSPSCDAKAPETCQVGDLSGKYGKIASDPFVATYTDDFVSLTAGTPAFFGNRSITVHFPNMTRITCANFVPVAANSCSSMSGAPSGTGVATIPAVSTRPTVAPGLNGTSSSNTSVSLSKPSPTSPLTASSSSVVQAGAAAKAPTMALAFGFAALAFAV